MGIVEARIEDMKSVRELFLEYQEWLGIDLCFQNFEKELSTLPGQYDSPKGAIILAIENSMPVGCIGVRPRTDSEAELKRLYVQSRYRGFGIGKKLFYAAMSKAKLIGYGSIVLDTHQSMVAAKSLYSKYGFKKTPSYYQNPESGVEYYRYVFT